MKIEIQSFNVPILTEVISSIEFNTMKNENPIVINDEDNEVSSSFDLCVRIIVDGYREIWYYINDHFHGIQDLKILLPENSNTLFIGGKSKSTVVDLVEGIAREEFNHFLFWDFKITPEGKYILDEGEIDCLVRDLSGKIINQTFVEPPYESEYVDKGILYHCDGLTGDVLLEFD
jgi:hypothetical protein